MQPAIRNFVFVFFGALLLHLLGSWSLPLIDRDEPRFAEASREMLERGDYVVPYLNNRYRFDKPPFTYWAHTVSYRVFGENDFAARFPSALAAALISVLLLAWGRRLGPERVGWWAAIIFALALQTFVHARAAVADMWLVLFMTATFWAGYELLRDRLSSHIPPPTPHPAQWRWTFYLALALAFLAKGPVGWLPLVAVAIAKFYLPHAPLARRFHFLRGSLLMLGLVALWGVPALVRTDWLYLDVGIGKHVIDRSFDVMEGHGAESLWAYLATLPFYFVTIFLSFAPWSIKLPWLAKRLWRGRDSVDTYLLVGAGVVFLVFTLVKTKLPHYTMPAIPLLALLLAKSLAQSADSARFIRRTAIFAGVVAAGLITFMPFAARFFPVPQLVREARADLRPAMEIGALDFREPSVVWYFRRHIDGWMVNLGEPGLRPFLERPGARAAIMTTPVAERVYPTLPHGWKKYRARGFNLATGKRVDLTLIVKPS